MDKISVPQLPPAPGPQAAPEPQRPESFDDFIRRRQQRKRAPAVDPGSPEAMMREAESPLERGKAVVREAITGEQRTQYPEAEELLQPLRTRVPHGSEARLLGGLATTTDERALADIAEGALPEGWKRTEDDWGNPMFTDQKGETFYLNKPGLSYTDVARAVTQAPLYYGPARWAQGAKSVVGKAARAAAGFLGLSVAQDALAQLQGSRQPVDWERAIATGAGGAVGEAMMPGIEAVWNKIPWSSNRIIDMRGRLTPVGRRVAEQAGIEPQALQDPRLHAQIQAIYGQMPAQMKEMMRREHGQFAREAEKAVMQEAGGEALSGSTGVPTTRGQRSGDVTQLRHEEGLRQGDFGQEAANRMRQLDERQQAGFRRQATRVQQAGTPEDRAFSLTEAEAGQRIREGLQGQMSRDRAAVRAKYREVADQGGDVSYVMFEDLAGMPGNIMRALKADDFDMSPKRTPGAFQWLQQFAKTVGAGRRMGRPAPRDPMGAVTGVQRPRIRATKMTFRKLENQRKDLQHAYRQARNTDPGSPDTKALKMMIEAFDENVDQLFLDGLMSGDPAALELMKGARAMAREFALKYRPQPGDRGAGRLIDQMARSNMDNMKVVDTILGASNNFGPSAGTELTRRLKGALGEDSEAFRSMRDAAAMRIIFGTGRSGAMRSGAADAPNIGLTGLRTRLSNALDGKPAELFAEMFTPEQLGVLRQIQQQANQAARRDQVTNWSNTAHQLTSTWKKMLTAVGIPALAYYEPMTLVAFLTARGAQRTAETARGAARADQSWRSSFRPTMMPWAEAGLVGAAAGAGTAAQVIMEATQDVVLPNGQQVSEGDRVTWSPDQGWTLMEQRQEAAPAP